MNKQIIILSAFLIILTLMSCDKKSAYKNKDEDIKVETKDSVEYKVEEWDRQKFSSRLSAQSFNDAVFEIISDEPLVQYFIKNRETSLPLLRRKFTNKDTITDEDRLKYFVVFAVCKDTFMVDTLYNYAQRVKNEPKGELEYTQHPYYPAMHGMELITGIKQDPFPAYLVKPDVFLNKVKEWKAKYGKK